MAGGRTGKRFSKLKVKFGKFKRRFIVLAVMALVAGLSGASYAVYNSLSDELPQISALKDYKPPLGTQILSSDDHVIGRLRQDKGIFVPLARIPANLKNAVIAVEDARFYKHGGLDYQGILRAVVKDVISLSLKEGGSTITQQLAKVLFLTPEKSLSRKAREVVLARKIEQKLEKDEILELYLNRIYFGNGAYGVEMAARTYFGKHVGDLNLAESAMLAGLISSPANYSPYSDMNKARRRQMIVLERMADERLISRGRADQAKSMTIILENLRTREEVAPYVVEQVRIYLEKKYGPEKVYGAGLKVWTTIDYSAQLAARGALERGIRQLDKRQGWRGPVGKKDEDDLEMLKDENPVKLVMLQSGDILTATVLDVDKDGAEVSARGARGRLALSEMRWAVGPKYDGKDARKLLSPGDVIMVRVRSFDREKSRGAFALEQSPAVQGALVSINPYTGYITAMVGGYDFAKSEFNHALSARRQPGSAFKPIVYAAAMEAGFTPASVIADEGKEYPGGWSPENFDKEFHGPTRLREALVRSSNMVTVELLNQVGVKDVLTLAGRLGLKGPFAKDLTLALGSCSATPVEMTSAFAAFANGGFSVKPIFIYKVTDSRGRILEWNWPEMDRVISSGTAYQVTSMLSDAVRRGTATRASELGRPAAGKTGTTSNYVDAWFVGYTTDMVTGVWIGFDDQKSLGHGETGSQAALPVWLSYMGKALADRPVEDFPLPEGMEVVDIDADTGLLPTRHSREVVKEYFKEGTAPDEYAQAPLDELPFTEKLLPGNIKRWLFGE